MDLNLTEQKNTEGIMMGLMKALEDLAPHPGRLDRAGPGYAPGLKKSISAQFNKHTIRHPLIEAYLKDLPKRLGIERWLNDYQRKLYALQKYAPAPAA